MPSHQKDSMKVRNLAAFLPVRRRLSMIVLAAVLVTPTGCLAPGEDSGPVAPLVGVRAPGFALTDLNGALVSLSDLQGQVVLLNFWTTW